MSKLIPYSSWKQAFASWLWTIVSGAAATFLFFSVPSTINSTHSGPLNGLVPFILPTAGFAAAVSILLVPLAYLIFGRLLLVNNRLLRLAGWLLAIGFLDLVAFIGMISIFGDDNDNFIAFGYPYLLASLLVNFIVYHQALFRPTTPRSEQP